MRGTIIKRSNDSYRIKVSLGKDSETGKYISHYETVKGNKKDAETRLNEIINQYDKGLFVKPGKVTLSDYLDRWLQDYARPNLAPRTREVYEMMIRQHLIKHLGNLPLTALRPEHLQKYYSERLLSGLSPQTVRHHHTLIHKALQTALEWGLLSRNVADSVKPPKVQTKDMQIWNVDEIDKFLESAKDTPYYALFHLALFSGMRRSELLALRWQDVDLILAEISVNRSLHQLKDNSYVFRSPKTAKGRRTIALPPSALLILQDHYFKCKDLSAKLDIPFNDDTLVFCHAENGKPIRPNTITRAWTLTAIKAELKHIRLHDARHSHASLMLKQGIHPKIVQERLGHSSIAITLDTYSHVTPGLQQAAAKSFDEAFTKSYNGVRVLQNSH
jgi:integrase